MDKINKYRYFDGKYRFDFIRTNSYVESNFSVNREV